MARKRKRTKTDSHNNSSGLFGSAALCDLVDKFLFFEHASTRTSTRKRTLSLSQVTQKRLFTLCAFILISTKQTKGRVVKSPSSVSVSHPFTRSYEFCKKYNYFCGALPLTLTHASDTRATRKWIVQCARLVMYCLQTISGMLTSVDVNANRTVNDNGDRNKKNTPMDSKVITMLLKFVVVATDYRKWNVFMDTTNRQQRKAVKVKVNMRSSTDMHRTHNNNNTETKTNRINDNKSMNDSMRDNNDTTAVTSVNNKNDNDKSVLIVKLFWQLFRELVDRGFYDILRDVMCKLVMKLPRHQASTSSKKKKKRTDTDKKTSGSGSNTRIPPEHNSQSAKKSVDKNTKVYKIVLTCLFTIACRGLSYRADITKHNLCDNNNIIVRISSQRASETKGVCVWCGERGKMMSNTRFPVDPKKV